MRRISRIPIMSKASPSGVASARKRDPIGRARPAADRGRRGRNDAGPPSTWRARTLPRRRRRCRIATYFLRRRGDARRAPPSRQLHPPRFERWQYRRNCSSPRRRHRRRRPTMPTLGRFPPSLDPMTSARSRHHCFRLFFSLQASEEERRCSTITSCSRCERDIAMALSSPPSVGGGHSLEPRRRRRCRRCSGRSGRARPPPPPLPVAWIWSTSSERSAEFVLWNV